MKTIAKILGWLVLLYILGIAVLSLLPTLTS